MKRVAPLACLCVLAAAPLGAVLAQEKKLAGPASLEAPTVEVIADTPLPGLGVPRDQVPANVQAVTSEDMERVESRSVPDFMERALPSVNVNTIQGNPFQVDVNYRGFNASPRLGIPQGLSVYLDGVRINEPLGDIVNWDLVPQSAIANVNLIPGSNPLFGLNTLGGALSLRTKSGEQFPGTSAELAGGSFGRKSAGFEHGGSRGELGWYVAGNWYDEDGWRDFAPSRLANVFAKVGRETADYDIDLSVLVADNRLIGNQVTPTQFLQQRWESIYTHPDQTDNSLAMVNLTASRWLTAERLVQGNVYYRHVKTTEFNVDLNDVTDPRFGVVPFEDGPNDLAAGGTGLNVDSTSINRLRSKLDGYGLTGQYSMVGGGAKRLTVGASYDYGRTDFGQSFQLGSFTPDRSGQATGAETESVSLLGRTETWSVFATGSLDLAPSWVATLSARHNHTQVKNTDRFPQALQIGQGLDADFTYRKLNPAVGVTFNPDPRFGAYAGFNQGNRAPSPIELGCADRANPCLLSNAVGSDPFLEQVVARTVEAGVRGRFEGGGWFFGVYRTNLSDDILFVSTATSAGFFTNFGKTRRQGIEAGVNGKLGEGFFWSANYSLVDATFRSSAALLSENNSSRGTVPGLADDETLVSTGNRIPGIPRHASKLIGEWRAGLFAVAATVTAFSSQFVSGNENNQHQPGTVTDLFGSTRTFEGSGRSAGYAVMSLNARYRLAKQWEIFGKITNLFDRRYTTAGVLGENAFPSGTFSPDSDTWVRDTFFAPGEPRAFWVGLRFAAGP